MPELLARSKAGHDKGKLYAVLGEEAERLVLTDGKNRPLNKPKRKNRLHVQVIRHLPEPVTEQLRNAVTDTDVRKVLQDYEKGANACLNPM